MSNQPTDHDAKQIERFRTFLGIVGRADRDPDGRRIISERAYRYAMGDDIDPEPPGTMTGVRVDQLEPGDRHVMDVPHTGIATSAIVVAVHTPHPLHPSHALVIWRMRDGGWSHDSLDPRQVLPGEVHRPSSHVEREQRLRAALHENNPGR